MKNALNFKRLWQKSKEMKLDFGKDSTLTLLFQLQLSQLLFYAVFDPWWQKLNVIQRHWFNLLYAHQRLQLAYHAPMNQLLDCIISLECGRIFLDQQTW